MSQSREPQALKIAQMVDSKTQDVISALHVGLAREGYTPDMLAIIFNALGRKAIMLAAELGGS